MDKNGTLDKKELVVCGKAPIERRKANGKGGVMVKLPQKISIKLNVVHICYISEKNKEICEKRVDFRGKR